MSEEQIKTSSEEDFATLLAQEETQPALQNGQIVKGSVIQIGEDSVFIDVRGKGEGIIARAELEDEEGTLQVEIGDEVEATILSTEGEIRLSLFDLWIKSFESQPRQGPIQIRGQPLSEAIIEQRATKK